jgi:signal peptidase I
MTLTRAAVLAVTCLVVFKFVLIPVRLSGGSMAPTYGNGINLVNRLAYRSKGPARGDVVAVRFRPTGRSVLYMKRVVGLPGERIGFRDGRVTVNDELIEESYLRFPSDWNVAPVLCGPDEYFVVGDNRSMPPEDHEHGRARRALIAGRMLW